nr:vegetative incompatibility protein het-e-1 [Quercus suber]
MFQWYRRARVCYAFLADVGHTSVEQRHQELRQSSWFLRGWTLQELLAPYRVEFCTHDWQVFGTKAEEGFIRILHAITKIPLPALRNPRLVTEFSVAQRMSWAAHRRTTRIEDQAYCLLGLLEVNMALLYGEGARAFQRLQREILAQSDDESIFAWTIDSFMAEDGLGVLASSPRLFAHSGDIVRTYRSRQPPCVTTSKGLSFTPRTSFYHDHLSEPVWIVYLECGRLKPRSNESDARVTGMFQRREVELCAIVLTREHQALNVTQGEWHEALTASKRVAGLDASLVLARRAKFQPTFYRVFAHTLVREEITESLPRGDGTLELDRSFYMKP